MKSSCKLNIMQTCNLCTSESAEKNKRAIERERAFMTGKRHGRVYICISHKLKILDVFFPSMTLTTSSDFSEYIIESEPIENTVWFNKMHILAPYAVNFIADP